MKKIDTQQWREFRVGDLFETVKNGKQVPTGASIPKEMLREKGLTPRITVSGVNNGIIGFFDYIGEPTENYRVYSNFISVSFLGTVFYHCNEASLDMKVHCLKPLNIILNKYTGQFLVSAIKSSLRQISYADQISSTVLSDLTIKLPASSNNQPDWMFMEKYMQKIEGMAKEGIGLIIRAIGSKRRKDLDTSSWKRFHLYDDELFTIDSGTKLDKVKMKNSNPTINFVGRSNANNGVTDFIDEIDGLKPYSAGCMTVSLGGEYLGSCFIQHKPFYTSQNVNVLIPKHEMSDYCKQFISTMIFREGRQRYKAFIDELNRHMKTDFSILLPVTLENRPDWDFMEKYMRTIEQEVKTTVQYLNQ